MLLNLTMGYMTLKLPTISRSHLIISNYCQCFKFHYSPLKKILRETCIHFYNCNIVKTYRTNQLSKQDTYWTIIFAYIYTWCCVVHVFRRDANVFGGYGIKEYSRIFISQWEQKSPVIFLHNLWNVFRFLLYFSFI